MIDLRILRDDPDLARASQLARGCRSVGRRQPGTVCRLVETTFEQPLDALTVLTEDVLDTACGSYLGDSPRDLTPTKVTIPAI